MNINEIPELMLESMEQCIPQETEIKDVKLAAAYVPFQSLCSLFHPLHVLKHGTVFPELYSPYKGINKHDKYERQEMFYEK